jgi:DNA primase
VTAYRDLVEQVLRRANVRRLRRTPEGWSCCCPFHDEHSPSFAVGDNGLWICYSELCGRKGNLRQLLIDLAGYSVRDAIALAAAPPLMAPAEDVQINGAMTWSAARQPKGPEPLPEVLASVYSAFCPRYLLDRGFTKATCLAFEAGFDTETQQVVLPLRDGFGKLAGFVRRQTRDDAQGPRYIVDVPRERRALLFNLYRSGRRVIIVEGPLDAMWLHQCGYRNVVALLGSKLSHAQQQLLCRHTDAATLMLDNDSAGWAATQRLVERLYLQMPICVAAPFETGKDPADQDKDGIKHCIDNAITAEAWRARYVLNLDLEPSMNC